MKIARPVNDTQERFNELCDLGGGRGGGPVWTRLQQLLKESGRTLSIYMEDYVKQTLTELADYNPWHVCFAIGVSWGHLAKEDLVFTEAAARLLDIWNNDDLRIARRFHYERGPEPLVQSLWGGAILFRRVRLPEANPTDLKVLQQAQQRWLSPILSPDRPPYIGSWNSVAMFMAALFTSPQMWQRLVDQTVLLPPGGPIFNGLNILYKANILSGPPEGNSLDDEAFQPGALYVNQALMEELHRGHSDWSITDVHGGIYLLGTRFRASQS